MKRIAAALLCAVCLVTLLLLPGCGRASDTGSTSEAVPFTPVFHENHFSNQPDVLGGDIEADLSTASDGYIGIRLLNENKIKAQITCGEVSLNYTLRCDGTVNYLPVQYGSGNYHLQILQNTTESRYVELASADFTAEYTDEFAPFLHSNVYVSYTRDSDAVRLADEMAAEAGSELNYFEEVYNYIKDNVSYDYDLATTVQSGYLPDPDRTLEGKKGICLDYASLAAAMFRSQGIPTKLVTGYVGQEELYHAWDVVYLKEVGWVSVELKISETGWNRIDITFASNGDQESLYVDRYVY